MHIVSHITDTDTNKIGINLLQVYWTSSRQRVYPVAHIYSIVMKLIKLQS